MSRAKKHFNYIEWLSIGLWSELNVSNSGLSLMVTKPVKNINLWWYLLGHGGSQLQVFVSEGNPSHGKPLYFGALQYRVRVWLPQPHDTEHAVNSPQFVQTPFTITENVEKLVRLRYIFN